MSRKGIEFIHVSSTGTQVHLSAALRKIPAERMDLYEHKETGTLALVPSSTGELHIVARKTGASPARSICSNTLAAVLQTIQPSETQRRIPVWVDLAYDALLLYSRDDIEFSYDTFRRLDLSSVRPFPCRVTSDSVYIRRAINTRTEAYMGGEQMAFVRRSDGPVILEEGTEGYVIRKPEVVAFARSYWRGKQLFSRRMDNAVVVSADIRRLCRLVDLSGFVPLQIRQVLSAELMRSFRIQLSPAAVSAVGKTLSVYACGSHLALMADPEGGDIELDDTGTAFSQRLSQQLSMRFEGDDFLFLVPHGDLLVFSKKQSPDTRSWPPADYFCRLLMKPGKTTRLMRYGTYNPPKSLGKVT